MKNLTAGICPVFRGLNFENNADIGRKGNYSGYPEAMRPAYRKLLLTPFLLVFAYFLLKLNYTPGFRQNFPLYRQGLLQLPPSLFTGGISGVPFYFFFILVSSASLLIAWAIPGSTEVFKRLFLRNKRAVAGLLLLVFTLVPDSSPSYKTVGFILSSLALFFILLYFLHPLLLKAGPYWLRAGRAVLSLSTGKLLWVVFLAVFLTANLVSYKVFDHYPHIYNSTAQLFQAKIFLRGQLSEKAIQPRKFFVYNSIILDVDGSGRWYAQFPPGHALLLLLGLLINAPWLVNPFFGSLSVILLYLLGRELYGEATGRLCLLLGAVSPFVLFMSSEYMSHATAAFFLILGFYWGVRAEKKPSYHALGAGAALGMAHLIRPFSAFVVSLPFILYLLFSFIKQGRHREIGFLFISLGLFAGILLAYNTLTNGHPLLFGYNVLFKSQLGLGFGYSPNGLPPHTPRLGLTNLLNNLNQLNLYLFQWPVPSLVFVVILLGSGSMTKNDKLLIVCFASLIGGFFFFWSQHLLFGPRYMYEGAFILVLLSARGIVIVKDLLGDKGYLWGVLAICVLVGMLHVRSLAFFYADDYWDFNPALLENIQKKKINNALVFCRYYHNAFPGVEPDANADVLFARDLGEEENKELIQRYPGRKLYRALRYDIYPYYPFQ